jgi:hypothetical protein
MGVDSWVLFARWTTPANQRLPISVHSPNSSSILNASPGRDHAGRDDIKNEYTLRTDHTRLKRSREVSRSCQIAPGDI